jgi:hypothetical protein
MTIKQNFYTTKFVLLLHISLKKKKKHYSQTNQILREFIRTTMAILILIIKKIKIKKFEMKGQNISTSLITKYAFKVQLKVQTL